MIPILTLAGLIESQLQVLLILNRPPLLILKKASLSKTVVSPIVDRGTGELIVKKCEDFRGQSGRGFPCPYYQGAFRSDSDRIPLALLPMIAFLFALAWKAFLPVLLLVALVDVLTQSRPQRIRRLHRAGLSQRSIASRLGVSRHQVKLALA
jgi:hypothetical protein